MIASPKWLYLAYVANIVILLPVCWSMFQAGGTASVFEDKVVDSAGLRLLVGSLWTAILLASIAGLIWPAFFAPVLLIQIVYKGLWLLAFVLPLWRAGEAYPAGIALVFLAIILIYPLLFWLSTR